jgi:hypothetical protein
MMFRARAACAPLLAVLLCLLLAPSPARAQDTPRADSAGVERLDLPREVAQRLIDFFNQPGTLHLEGESSIPAERTITGNVAVIGGPLLLAGRIEGDVVMINGDVELLPGAVITGRLTVAGGAIRGAEHATVGGEMIAYEERLRYLREGERLAPRGAFDGWWGARRAARRSAGGETRMNFLVATGQSYNRVEGMPIVFGPVLRTAGSNPLEVRALGIYRTESGATLDELGYYLRAEQEVGGRGAVSVGGSFYSMIDAIEPWQLSNLENGLSSFLFRRDARDYYLREGGSGFVRVTPRGTPFSFGAQLRRERHTSRAAGTPWSLLGDDDWRLQPLVAEGWLTSLTFDGALDTRSERDDPSTGWYLQASVERALDASLARPAAALSVPLGTGGSHFTFLPAKHYDAFTSGLLDLRRYNRLGPDSRLNLRLVAGGSLGSGALPPQRQHALGGWGTLPGYSLLGRDCGAREHSVRRAAGDQAGERFYTRYGCDAFGLFQAEYRGKVVLRFDALSPFGRDDDPRPGKAWNVSWDSSPEWALFFDAGRGWARGGEGHSEDLALDVGAGLLFGKVGLYAAVPLTESGVFSLFVRLGPRF